MAVLGFFIVLFLIALIPASIASGKGRSFFWWWVYGVAIWIVALIHALMLKTSLKGLDKKSERKGLAKCPACAEWIKPEATVCRYCGRDVVPGGQFAPAAIVAHGAAAPGSPTGTDVLAK